MATSRPHRKGFGFPASKKDMFKRAKDNGADGALVDTLQNMPDQEDGTMAGVMQGLGQSH